jgi:hypothetical protein
MAVSGFSDRVRFLVLVITSAGLGASTVPLSYSGEPIQFIDKPPPKAVLPSPTSASKAAAPEKTFDFERSTTPQEVIGPQSGPDNSTAARKRRLQELRDQQENWIFSLPEETSRRVTGEALMEVEDWSSSKSRKPATAMERYWEKQGEKQKEKSNQTRTKNRAKERATEDEAQPTDKKSDGPQGEGPKDFARPDQKLVLDWNNVFKQENPSSALTAEQQIGRIFDQFALPTASRELQEERKSFEKSALDFQRLLEGGSVPGFATLPTDPINSLLDPARRELQPAAGKLAQPSTPGPAANAPKLPDLFSGTGPSFSASSPNALESFGGNNSGQFNLPTPRLQLPEQRMAQPTPATMFELPRRKF